MSTSTASQIPSPPFRCLRGYAFDPSLSTQLDTAVVNKAVFKVMWEDRMASDESIDTATAPGLGPGPVGEYIEVIDYDPASGVFYEPVDLNDPLILAQNGLPPSEGNPQFHQQMVYAVAMTTIRHFERALGRLAFWSPYWSGIKNQPETFVRRLRIYPHAMREANAYYSPSKKALLFGYFPAVRNENRSHFPGGIVFTCLSHDIIAHETTHALLDGMHRRFIEPTHPDTLAFHEAFADLVALFQHFTFSDVLRHQIATTRGELASRNLLGQLAQQFGNAIGHYGALRDAIGEIDPETGAWRPKEPDPDLYATVMEPHARGSILVAAVFDAFLSIYKGRVADLFRIATSGTGVLPEGALHPDLVDRLASEAAKAAHHVLTMCIRALDYCPTVGIRFDEYLRAIITADRDLVPDDDLGYRIAFIEAFRRRGIYPRDVRALSEDILAWGKIPGEEASEFKEIADWLRNELHGLEYATSREDLFNKERELRRSFHRYLDSEIQSIPSIEKITTLVLDKDERYIGEADGDGESASSRENATYVGEITLNRSKTRHNFEVHALRRARRVGPDGDRLDQAIICITQQRIVRHNDCVIDREGKETFMYRGGCTLIIDLDTMTLRYAITKDIKDDHRLARNLTFRKNVLGQSLRATYFGSLADGTNPEPFALLHRMF